MLLFHYSFHSFFPQQQHNCSRVKGIFLDIMKKWKRRNWAIKFGNTIVWKPTSSWPAMGTFLKSGPWLQNIFCKVSCCWRHQRSNYASKSTHASTIKLDLNTSIWQTRHIIDPNEVHFLEQKQNRWKRIFKILFWCQYFFNIWDFY